MSVEAKMWVMNFVITALESISHRSACSSNLKVPATISSMRFGEVTPTGISLDDLAKWILRPRYIKATEMYPTWFLFYLNASSSSGNGAS